MASNAKENVSRKDYDGFCNICKKNFGSLDAVMEHQKVALNKKETKYKCDKCNRGFETKEAPTEHRNNGH
ncbi:hypothetical protein CCACVL1_16534 [Corchorus capsularis]|uniref:C2H2-type domain-containing protein n=1 Tax=Corchorus capsularis TaxID=210143 RepID=A0A1R3HWE9_COCAP|nr:hypothetical protein CCACVL1_16534 [Corchorus capsularis]